MERKENEKILLPTGHKIIWSEATVVPNSSFKCKKCETNVTGFRVDKLKELGCETDVVFCINCTGIVWKPHYFGSTFASTELPVCVLDTDGYREQLKGVFPRGKIQTSIVLHCKWPMVRIAKEYVDHTKWTEHVYECMVCRRERKIITNGISF